VNVLHVNNVDLAGRRFNGFDLLDELGERGVHCSQAVMAKSSKHPRVFSLAPDPGALELQHALNEVESRHSMSDLLYPWGRVLAETEQFKAADVVHYHLIHNQMVSLIDLPALVTAKPSVWTFHDPWPLTGHCVYPRGCERWLAGCTPCEHLEYPFPMKEDRAGRMWQVKKQLFERIDVDIVVASEFMLDMVRRSPLTRDINTVHLVPFGIRTDAYLPDEQRAASRKRLGIPQQDQVLLFRSTQSEVKGMKYIIEALKLRSPQRPVTLLTLEKRHLLKELAADYNIVELGWVDDPSIIPDVYSACDVLLMPSTAEAFGLMALEAMAAGRPVVCFEGTSLPAVTHAPECGIAVPMGDATALRDAIDHLAADPEETQRRGRLARSIAATQFSHAHYLDSLIKVYVGAIERFPSERTTPCAMSNEL